MEFFGFSFHTGEFHEQFLFWGDEGGFSEVGDFFAEFLFEQGRLGGLGGGGGGGHLQMFVEMTFVVCFFPYYVLWETEGLVERSFFLNAVVKGKEEKRGGRGLSQKVCQVWT